MVIFMAYSRWSNSNWYSFYSCWSDGLGKNDQVLSIWYAGEERLIDLTYEDLIEIKSPEQLALYYKSDIPIGELEEAMEYISWFIQDVNEEFADDKK